MLSCHVYSNILFKPCYGELKACVMKKDDNTAFCVIQIFYTVENTNGEQLYNEQDCPLLRKSNQLLGISASTVMSPVSIVHECLSCPLQVKRKRQRFEREDVNTNTLVLKHDFKNNLFALNIYCMHTIAP